MKTFSQWQLRAEFARRLSDMYGREVPAYTTVISRESRGCRVLIDGACHLDRLRPAAGEAEVFEMRDHLVVCAGPVSGL
ncbi:hypothetical protein [Amycolatopsis sulphurea]|uniref:hypothetical protein n=1 Tax=Amycolatopsis sulphurea TaxID=76022 RepID=UPI001B809CF0|nr:hypothetical protein [Amycolatopsis sulphurea]